MADVRSKLRQDPDIEPVSNLSSLDLPVALRYLISVAMTAVATALAVGIDSRVTIPNLSLVFVVPVVMAAVGLGLGPSLFSAILGALAFNFFLTEPRYTLIVNDPANVWAIGLLFVVGLVVSGVAFTSDRRAAEAALLKRQVTLLQGYSREVAAADNIRAIALTASRALAALFDVPAVVILVLDGKVVSVERVGWSSTAGGRDRGCNGVVGNRIRRACRRLSGVDLALRLLACSDNCPGAGCRDWAFVRSRRTTRGSFQTGRDRRAAFVSGA